VPERNEREALEAYAQPFKAALSCVTVPHLGTLVPVVGRQQSLVFRDGRARLLRDIRISDEESPYLYLIFNQYYRIIEDQSEEPSSRYRVTTEGWKHDILDDKRREILSYHWHPDGHRDTPHMHVGSVLLNTERQRLGKGFSSLHLPTERISIEQIVRLLIEEFEVIPKRGDWRRILENGQKQFEATRSWPHNKHTPRPNSGSGS
jgi:hypothetical protein